MVYYSKYTIFFGIFVNKLINLQMERNVVR